MIVDEDSADGPTVGGQLLADLEERQKRRLEDPPRRILDR